MSIEYLSDFFSSRENLLVISAGVSAALTILPIWYGLLARDPMGARAGKLRIRRQDMIDHLTRPKNRKQAPPAMGLIRTIVERLNLFRQKHVRETEKKLAKASYREKDALVIFLFTKLAAPIMLAAIAMLAVFLFGVDGLSLPNHLLMVLAAAAIGMFAPDWFIRYRTVKRRKAMSHSLPDGLDLLVICAESGLSLDAALARVADEIAGGAPELADELALTAMELGFLPDRRSALNNLVTRTELASIRSVVNTLKQTEKYGTPLADSLRVLAREFRSDRMLKAEAKAAKLPAILTVPMIVFILPTLFIVLLGPAAIKSIEALKGF